jgi:Protein of unknown function (DUF3592)
VIAPVCLTAGVLAVVWALLAYRAQRRFLSKASRAMAVIQSLRAETMQRNVTIYFPIIQFTTAADVVVTTESKTTRAGVRVGQQLTVLYDPANPKNVEIDSFWSHWAVVFVASSFAVLLLISGGAALVDLATSSGG